MKLNTAGIILSILMSSAVLANDSNYEKALTAYHQDEIEAAYIHSINALKDNPNSLHAKLLFSDILVEKQSYKEAQVELTEALEMGADVNLISDKLIDVLMRRGEYTEVLTVFDNYSLNSQSEYKYSLAKGRARLGLEDYDGALNAYQAMSRQYPDDLEVQLGIVSVYLSTGQLVRAEQGLSSLKAQADKNEKITRYLGTLAFEKGNFSSALAHFQHAHNLAPNNVQSIRGLVNTYISLEQYEQAKMWVDKLTELTPIDPQVRLLDSMILRNIDEEFAANELSRTLTEQLSNLDQTFMLSQPQLLLVDALASYGQNNWEQARKKFKIYIKQAQDKLDIRAVVLLADVYNALEQPQQALQLLTRYESKLITNKDYALLLAGTYIKYDKSYDANKLLVQLREIYGADPSVLLMSAHLLSNNGSTRQAIEMLTNVDVPKNNNYIHTLAALYLNVGDFVESLALSSKLAKEEPKNIEYRLLEVKGQIGTGLVDEAEENIRTLYQSNKESPDVQFEYARLLFNIGQADEAKNELEELTRRFPKNGLYKLTLGEVEYSLGQISSAVNHLQSLTIESGFRKQAQYNLAIIYLQYNQFELALDAANQIQRLDQIDIDGMHLKALALVGLEEPELAQLQFNKLYSWWIEDAPKLVTLSKMQMKLGLLNDASKSLSQALKLTPNNLNVLIAVIKVEIKQGHFVSASERISKMKIAKQYDNKNIQILEGELAEAQGNIDAAFNAYSQVIKQDSSNVIAFMKLNTLARINGYPQQFADLAEAVVNDLPDKPFYRTKLADHLMWMKNWPQAKYHYQVLLTKKIPKSEVALALNNLAVIHLNEDNFEQAIQMSQQALNLYPNVPAILDTAGWALTKSGQADRGLSHLRQAYSMNASDPEVLYHLAYTLTKLNKVPEAMTMLNNLTTLPSDNKYRIEAELLIKQIE